MNAERLLQAVSSALFKNLPPGISRGYLRSFLRRNQAGLQAAIRQQFDRMCRPDLLVPGYETPVGEAVLPVESSGQLAVFGKDNGSSPHVRLVVKARCHPGDPKQLREFAVHSRRDDEQTWRPHPGETWHGTEDAAIQEFARAHAHEARWFDHKAEVWIGDADAPYVFTDEVAAEAAADERGEERFEERSREVVAARERRQQQPQPQEDTSRARTQPGSDGQASPSMPTLGSSAELASPVETPWGGLRSSSPLDPSSIAQNRRVVTQAGLHGVVRKALVYTFTTSRLAFTGAGIEAGEPARDKRYEFTVGLDSGRSIDTQEALFDELARPTRVVPDLSFDDGNHWLSPDQAWKEVVRGFDSIAYYRKKAQDSRKQQYKDQYLTAAEKARNEFNARMQAFTEWRMAHPQVAISDLDLLVERKLQLEAQVKGTGRRMFGNGYRDEVQWLSTAPADWRTRFKPGDRVTVPIFHEERKLETHSDRLERIEGDRAFLAPGSPSVLLYYLRLDESAPSQAPTNTGPRYLIDLAKDLLAPVPASGGTQRTPSVDRGVFARVVKAFLVDQGIPVRTEVERGAWMSGIRLRPPEHGRWTEEMVSRMNALLPGLNARSSEATFHPWATAGREGNLMVDDFGTPSGILLSPDGIARFGPYLAKALKDAGLTLSRDGETWLSQHRSASSVSSPVTSPDAASPGYSRGGATTEQRQSAAEGCADISFSLEGYGLIRVVCGQTGRRDVWHNVYAGRARFGYNGGRWARGQRPPESVLRAIRERGITAFDATTERLEEPAPYGIDLRLDVDHLRRLVTRDPVLERLPEASSGGNYLDPVIGALVESGGLRADLITDIAPELRSRARAIPGLLREGGRSWLEAARTHYGPEIKVVVGLAPLEAWPGTEGTDSYIELVNYALDYCVVDSDPGGEDALEYLCACDRTPERAAASQPRPRAVGIGRPA